MNPRIIPGETGRTGALTYEWCAYVLDDGSHTSRFEQYDDTMRCKVCGHPGWNGGSGRCRDCHRPLELHYLNTRLATPVTDPRSYVLDAFRWRVWRGDATFLGGGGSSPPSDGLPRRAFCFGAMGVPRATVRVDWGDEQRTFALKDIITTLLAERQGHTIPDRVRGEHVQPALFY